MTPQLIYNIVFQDKCSEHLFFDNVCSIFEKAVDDWANIGERLSKEKSISSHPVKKEIIKVLGEERQNILPIILKYKSFAKNGNLVFEFNVNEILDSMGFVSADALLNKKKYDMTLLEKEFYDFIDNFIEEIEYKIVRQYGLLCMKSKRFDEPPFINHVIFNR